MNERKNTFQNILFQELEGDSVVLYWNADFEDIDFENFLSMDSPLQRKILKSFVDQIFGAEFSVIRHEDNWEVLGSLKVNDKKKWESTFVKIVAAFIPKEEPYELPDGNFVSELFPNETDYFNIAPSDFGIVTLHKDFPFYYLTLDENTILFSTSQIALKKMKDQISKTTSRVGSFRKRLLCLSKDADNHIFIDGEFLKFFQDKHSAHSFELHEGLTGIWGCLQ